MNEAEMDSMSEAGRGFDVQDAQVVLLRFLGENATFSFTEEELVGMTNLPGQLVKEALCILCLSSVVGTVTSGAGVEHLINEGQLTQARKLYGEFTGQASCRRCGCTHDWACEDGCWWVEPDLCSSCQEEP